MNYPNTNLPKPYTVGIIGGTSYSSTTPLYDGVNRLVNQHFGGLTSAPIWLASLDFGQIDALMRQNQWDEIFQIMRATVQVFHAARVDAVAIASNTLHRLAPQLVEQALDNVPLIHIGLAVANEIARSGAKKVALLGTKATMQGNFIKDCVTNKDVAVMVPSVADQDRLNTLIFNEYCKGNFNTATRRALFEIAYGICTKEEVDGLILGCTELGTALSEGWRDMLQHGEFSNHDVSDLSEQTRRRLANLQFFDSEEIYTQAIADFCCEGCEDSIL